MAKIVKEWGTGSIRVAVESGKDDANAESVHVHVYKNGRRTQSRIPGRCKDIDDKDADMAESLFYDNYYEIKQYYEDVKSGVYDN